MRENNKLKTALIDSTTEYQDIIFKLKEEKVKAEISLQQSHAADAHLKGRTTPNLLEEAKCWNLQQQLAVANEAIAKLQHKMMSMNQQHRSQL